MKASSDLSVITKVYDLILWLVPIVARLPRSYRFVLGERMERNLYGILELLIRAKYRREKAALLDDANVGLEVLRFHTRLAKDLELLSIERYEHAAKRINEIGRELGGWLRQQGGVQKS